jgi:peptidoglycan/LPS O-acetylase OafA/YrhL
MSERPPSLNYRADIDGLRSIAVISVLVFHAWPHVLGGGFAGVDVFFVLSGYLISGILLQELDSSRFSYRTFYARRIRRLLPALLTVFTASTLLAWALLYPLEFQGYGRELIFGAGFLANIGHINEFGGYFGDAAEHKMLLHLWSLGIEEQFYLLWPIALAVTYRFRRAALPWVLGLGILTSLCLSGYLCPRHPDDGFYYPHTRMWELGIGAALALWENRRDTHWTHQSVIANRLATLGLLTMVLSLVLLPSNVAVPGLWVVPPTLGTVLCLAAGPGTTLGRRVLASRPMVYVGQISYPLYLWHWPILVAMRLIWPHSGAMGLAAALIAATLLSVATARWIEAPLRHCSTRSPAILGLAALLVAFVALGACIKAGVPSARLHSAELIGLENAQQAWDYPGHNFLRQSGFSTEQLGPQGAPTTLVIGDSHAEQYWAYFKARRASGSLRRGVRFATSGGCVPIRGINRQASRYHCDAFAEYAAQQARLPEVDTVVFSAFWEGYFIGAYQSTDPRDLSIVDLVHPGTPIRVETLGYVAALQRFEQESADLRAAGKRVFIVLPNPSSSRLDPAYRLPARTASNQAPLPTAQSASISRIDFEAFIAPVVHSLQELAKRQGAFILDPLDSLCDAVSCAAQDPAGPLYRDADHLNTHAAISHGSFLGRILAP